MHFFISSLINKLMPNLNVSTYIIYHLSLQVRHCGRWVHEEALPLCDGDSGGARLVLKVLQGLQKEDVRQYRVGFSNLVFFL